MMNLKRGKFSLNGETINVPWQLHFAFPCLLSCHLPPFCHDSLPTALRRSNSILLTVLPKTRRLACCLFPFIPLPPCFNVALLAFFPLLFRVLVSRTYIRKVWPIEVVVFPRSSKSATLMIFYTRLSSASSFLFSFSIFFFFFLFSFFPFSISFL